VMGSYECGNDLLVFIHRRSEQLLASGGLCATTWRMMVANRPKVNFFTRSQVQFLKLWMVLCILG
jgi:hypothetical protein